MAETKDNLLMALDALKPYLSDLVISGGWVPFIYHAYLGTPRPKHPPLMTEDLDISVAADRYHPVDVIEVYVWDKFVGAVARRDRV